MDIRPNAWREVRVTGERGLKATMVKLAFNRGMCGDTGWLTWQSDASLALLEAIAGDVLCGEWQRICAEIARHTKLLRINDDLLSLLHHYGLPASAVGVKRLCKRLKRAFDRERFADAEIDETLAQHGLRIPRPLGHPDRWEAARIALHAYLHDPTSPDAAPLVCRVESDAYGDPPRRARLEARKLLPEGFVVWFSDEHVCPDGRIIAIRPNGIIDPRDTDLYRWNTDYSAQRLCGLMPPHLGRYQAMDIRPNAWREVRVTGERGLKATMLKLKFNRGMWSDTDWLESQSDASLTLIEAIAGDVLCGEWQGICGDIYRYAARFPIRNDLLSLLDRYGLPASAAGVKSLYQQLAGDVDRLGFKRRRDVDAEIDEMLREHGLTIPHPRGHPDRWGAARMAIFEHLYDPTTPGAIARDDRIDAGLAELGLTLPFPRGHPQRPHAFFEAKCDHYGGRPQGWYPFKPPPPADTWMMPPPEPATKPSKRLKKRSRRSKTPSKGSKMLSGRLRTTKC
jgi:hypothetical protein